MCSCLFLTVISYGFDAAGPMLFAFGSTLGMLTLKRKSLMVLGANAVAGPASPAWLSAQLLRWSMFNLLLAAAAGVLMRALPFMDGFPLTYKNVLHGHSHFAFGGWVMPVLLALVLKAFPQLADGVAYRHWRNISVLLMASAYGMLLAFPLQGYKPLSVLFATLSIVAGYYLTWVVWKALRHRSLNNAYRLLKAGLLYLTLASLGPFATGPLVALGLQETPIYFNAIYGYLHFTYNGFFTFTLLALLYRAMEQKGCSRHGRWVYQLMHAACVPAYALSVLWSQPAKGFYVLGGVAALLQLVATAMLLRDAGTLQWIGRPVRWVMVIALLAFVLKNILQLASALPAAAEMAARNRGMVIAYLHLVMLGFVSMGALALCLQQGMMRLSSFMRQGLWIFLTGFVATELLLVAAGFTFVAPHYGMWLLACSLVMLCGLSVLFKGSYRKHF